jgi:hypothetical protein
LWCPTMGFSFFDVQPLANMPSDIATSYCFFGGNIAWNS